MTYIVDIILVAVFAVVIISSAVKGFFKSLVDLIGSLVAVVIAKLLSESAAKAVFDGFVYKGAENALAQSLGEAGSVDYVQQIENALASLPEGLGGILQIMGIDSQSLMDKLSGVNLGGDNLVESLMNSVVVPLGTAVVQFVLFVILALVMILVVKVFSKVINKIIKKLPVIKGLNKTMGAVFGILRGLIIVVIISMLLSVVVGFTGNDALIGSVENSMIINAVRDTMTSLIGINF